MSDTITAIHALTEAIAKRTVTRSEAELTALSALQVAVSDALGTELAGIVLVRVVAERDALRRFVEAKELMGEYLETHT